MSDIGIQSDRFGTTAEGEPVERFTLQNRSGITVRLITFGATITELHVPDRHGQPSDIVLGFDQLAAYEAPGPYFGCTVGRVAFRTAWGRLDLDGRSYQLSRNNGPHHLHGGMRGFSRRVWQAEPQVGADGTGVKLTHFSPDGDEGYPGNLSATVVITLTAANVLCLDYSATTDSPTPVNLTNHSYFNLAGAGRGSVLGHVVQIAAEHYSENGRDMIPTGRLLPVAQTPWDLRKPVVIGSRIGPSASQISGYDLAYHRAAKRGELTPAAIIEEPISGRRMEVETTEPALIFYTGNNLDVRLRGKGGLTYGPHAGLCLETGDLPDAVHHPVFPSTILRPGESYRHRCLYRFLPIARDAE